jgi:pimeloyl-ACP methyl ester carboxylesterase
MEQYLLSDFGGCFLTTEPRHCDGRSVPGTSAYVEWFLPSQPKPVSVTLVHGGGGQGSEFLRTPDNRPGWVHAFLKAGYAVYVVDRPGHGRNHWNPAVLGPALPAPGYDTLMPRFVDVARRGTWPEAALHTQWPAQPVDGGDRFMASQGPMATRLAASQHHVEEIAAALFDLVGDTVLLTHSAGGPCGWALSAIGGTRVKAIIAVEPLGAPGMTHPQGSFEFGLCAAPCAGPHDPYRPPVALLTSEATWMRAMNFEAAAFLRTRSAAFTHFDLPRHGIRGNGHMMMSELNSDQIAQLMIGWLQHTL